MTWSNQNCETNTNSVCMTGSQPLLVPPIIIFLMKEGGRSCCQQFSAYDKKTPGKFKLEFQGERMVALCSKSYVICSENQTKRSSKGLSQKQNHLGFQNYLDTLLTKESCGGKHIGFRLDSHHQISTYQQSKQGLAFFYPKRKVLDEGISTILFDL